MATSIYTVTFTRSYRDDAEQWHDSESFSGTQLLRVAHLAPKVYDQVNELRAADRAALENRRAAANA